MRLPGADVAVVDERKITEYLPNPKHLDGASKAAFSERLEFRVEDWQELAKALLIVARNWPVTKSVESVHGRKYIIEGEITSPTGNHEWVRTVWTVGEGTEIPRLVTAYPCSQV